MNLNDLLQALTAAASVTLGLFVCLRDPKKLPNLMLGLLCLAIGGWCGGQFFGGVSLTKAQVLFWTRFNLASAVLIPVCFFCFISAFTKSFSRDRAVLALATAGALCLLLADLTPWFVADVAPNSGFRYYPVPGPAYPYFTAYLLGLFLAAFYKLAAFLRASRGAEANQAKYILFASLVGFGGGVTAFFPVFGLDWPVVSYLVLPVYLAITAYAIVRHRLLDINIVLRAGLVYSLLTVLFAGFYALAILAANEFFRNLARADEAVVVLSVVFLSVLVFQPIRDRVQGVVDRLFFRGNYLYEQRINVLSRENFRLYQGLQQADKLSALGTIAAGMAHEIKNPLASIKGLTQVLPENLDDPQFISKYSEIVPRQLDRIDRIVRDLLDFGQPDKLALERVDLAGELEAVLRLVGNQCRQGNIAVVRELEGTAPVNGNPAKLSQAFLNIVLNAIQAMPEGGVLTLRTYDLPLTAVIEISDTGQGIPAEKLPKIFDPFYTTKEQGTGLGLAVTHRIVKEHAGVIEVASEPGRGTTFKLCLPIRPEPSV